MPTFVWCRAQLADIDENLCRAERRAGEMLAAMPKATGTRGRIERTDDGGYQVEPPRDDTQTLADLGVTKAQSSRWQKPAAVPEDQFEQAVAAGWRAILPT